MKLNRSTNRMVYPVFKSGWIFLVATLVGSLVEESSTLAQVTPPLAVGFSAADSDSDGGVSENELTIYLRDRLKTDSLPYTRIFQGIDADQDGKISPAEFENRHAVLESFVSSTDDEFLPADPGPNFIPYRGVEQPIDDRGVFGAIYHRYREQLSQSPAWKEAGWKRIKLDEVATNVSIQLPATTGQKPELDRLIRATIVIGGGGSEEEFFAGGAVIISPDGLALTNYHIAEAFSKKLLGLMADGRVVRVTEFVAGSRAKDVAVVRLEGDDFPWVPVAQKAPAMSDDLVVIHHTENRFFTYDRGYVKRFPMIGNHPWMEISADYAPGGSGCGIFNSNHELVGLVSTIVMGDGPMIASAELMEGAADSEEKWFGGEESDEGAYAVDPGALVVKLAVPWTAIQSTFKKEAPNDLD